MKRIAVVTKQMIIGGIENSLIHLLGELQKEDCEIYIFLEKEGGEFRNLIPKGCVVGLIPGIDMSAIAHVNKLFMTEGIVSALSAGYKILKNRFGVSYYQECENVSKILPLCNVKFDIAIAYSTPISLATLYVKNNIFAKKKILFIHNEIDKLGIPVEEAAECFNTYDQIYCVSSKARQLLVEKFPDLENKSIIFNNIVNKQIICSLADIGDKLKRKGNVVNILTVGRLSDEKGQDIIPYVARLLMKIGINFKWSIVGSGPLEGYILDAIEKNDVSMNVELLGASKNPYGFFESCDIYVQTSRQEGYGITLTEAKCFAKPIITTNFAGAFDQIDNGVNGLIVDFSEKEIADAICILIQEPELCKRFRDRLVDFQPDIQYQRKIIFEMMREL